MALRTVRFWHPSGSTIVVGTFQVPLGLLTPSALTPSDSATYRVRLKVADSTGLTLYEETWREAVSALALSRGRSAASAESFTFAVAPGRYLLRVEIEDSSSGIVGSEQKVIAAYDAAPFFSDLVAASGIRALQPGESGGRGSIEKASLAITTASDVTILPSNPVIYYYAEAYPAEVFDSAEVQFRILDESGRALVVTPPVRRRYPPEGGLETGRLDVRGLPPGSYRLVLRVASTDTSLERVANFSMGRAVVETQARPLAPVSGRFVEMGEAALDSLFGPLGYVLSERERGVYETLPLEGKRRFFSEAFRRRDPTPATPENEFEQEFMRRVERANELFGERSAAGRPGWLTDPGRIYLKYGPPDEKYGSPVSASGRAWQLWKYTSTGSRPHRYIFWDESGFENYVLLHTDNRNEPSRPHWETIVGTDAAEEILRFF